MELQRVGQDWAIEHRTKIPSILQHSTQKQDCFLSHRLTSSETVSKTQMFYLECSLHWVSKEEVELA